jgi:hypothetical protein
MIAGSPEKQTKKASDYHMNKTAAERGIFIPFGGSLVQYAIYQMLLGSLTL